MNGWIKVFKDGSEEKGLDSAVERGEASWSRGRLDDMEEVILIQDNKVLSIVGPGEFWQSDDYEVSFFETKAKKVKRRIQKKITKKDEVMHTTFFHEGKVVVFTPLSEKYNYTADEKTKLDESLIGKWFTIEVDLEQGGITSSFEDNKI